MVLFEPASILFPSDQWTGHPTNSLVSIIGPSITEITEPVNGFHSVMVDESTTALNCVEQYSRSSHCSKLNYLTKQIAQQIRKGNWASRVINPVTQWNQPVCISLEVIPFFHPLKVSNNCLNKKTTNILLNNTTYEISFMCVGTCCNIFLFQYPLAINIICKWTLSSVSLLCCVS